MERGRELRADFKVISRELTRKGTALAKHAKCSKDYDVAIETFQKALREHRNPDTLKKLNEAERAKKELLQQEYYDPKLLAEEEREKGMRSIVVISSRPMHDYVLTCSCWCFSTAHFYFKRFWTYGRVQW